MGRFALNQCYLISVQKLAQQKFFWNMSKVSDCVVAVHTTASQGKPSPEAADLTGPDQAALKLLAATAYPHYRLEFNTFMANHLAHGIVALHRLGATEARMKHFVDEYKRRRPIEQETETIESGPLGDSLGKRQQFPRIFAHYKSLSSRLCLDDLLRSELPKLVDGLPAGLYHPLIQIAYGYNVKSTPTVVEGLTYLHYLHMPLRSNIVWTAQGSDSLLKVMEALREDKHLIASASGKLDEHAKKLFWENLLPWQEMNFVFQFYHGDMLMSHVQRLGLGTKPTREEITKFAFDAATEIYLRASVRNDFFLLHGITAAWSLKEIAHLLPSDADVMAAVGRLLASFFSLYLSRGKYPLVYRVACGPATNGWEQIVSRAVEMDTDEHIYKLVQVFDDMRRRYPERSALYKQAALLSMDQPLTNSPPT